MLALLFVGSRAPVRVEAAFVTAVAGAPPCLPLDAAPAVLGALARLATRLGLAVRSASSGVSGDGGLHVAMDGGGGEGGARSLVVDGIDDGMALRLAAARCECARSAWGKVM